MSAGKQREMCQFWAKRGLYKNVGTLIRELGKYGAENFKVQSPKFNPYLFSEHTLALTPAHCH
jgi:hypothetical protein